VTSDSTLSDRGMLATVRSSGSPFENNKVACRRAVLAELGSEMLVLDRGRRGLVSGGEDAAGVPRTGGRGGKGMEEKSSTEAAGGEGSGIVGGPEGALPSDTAFLAAFGIEGWDNVSTGIALTIGGAE
jgi:hypothetical protein